MESAPHKAKAETPHLIPTSDQAMDERGKLRKIMGVVYPGHGSPSVNNIIGGLRSISAKFAAFD